MKANCFTFQDSQITRRNFSGIRPGPWFDLFKLGATMAALTQDKRFKTFSVSTAGDTLLTRGKFCKLRNMGANVVSISDSANPTAAITAGDQSSLIPVASTGLTDGVVLRPYTTYYVRAVSGATLCACDEIENLPFN